MIGSPLEAHPLPGTSRYVDELAMESCTPPSYDSQEAPPPYPSLNSSTPSTQPRTRSVAFGAGVDFEWDPNTPRSPDDIIIVSVRVNVLANHSQSSEDSLPERPRPRNFFRRLSSRLSLQDSSGYKFRAVRMPRREYLRHHRHDSNGNYAGSEPERNWDDAMIGEHYGQYRRCALSGTPWSSLPLDSQYHMRIM